MVICKSPAELEKMHRAGLIVWGALEKMRAMVRPGLTTKELDEFAEAYTAEHRARPAFKGYRGYPGSVCTSINQEVVHGIPSQSRRVKEGDILSMDFGVELEGYFGDAALTVPVGKIAPGREKLLRVTRESLDHAIEKVRPGNRLGDVSAAVQQWVEGNGFSVVREFVGHGIGTKMHEEPHTVTSDPGTSLSPIPCWRSYHRLGISMNKHSGLTRRDVFRRTTVAAVGIFSGYARAASTPNLDLLSQFEYGDVQFPPGPLQRQFDENRELLLNLSEDSLLRPYRLREGLPAPGQDLGGWYDTDAFAPGFTYGQWMSALARYYAASGDQACREKVSRMVQRLRSHHSSRGQILYRKSLSRIHLRQAGLRPHRRSYLCERSAGAAMFSAAPPMPFGNIFRPKPCRIGKRP